MGTSTEDPTATSNTVLDDGEGPALVIESPEETARDDDEHAANNNGELDPICCCCWNMREAALLCNGVTVFVSIFLPVLGVSGVISVVGFHAVMESLLHMNQEEMDRLYKLEHQAWIIQLVIGCLVAIATLVPTYGVYLMHRGMIAFGIVLLVCSALTRYCVGWIYLEKANREIICQVSTEACQYNSFRQPYGVYVISTVVVAIFIYLHAYLLWGIRAKRSFPSPRPRGVMMSLAVFVFLTVILAGAYAAAFAV